jgi:DNA-binding NarL/FixJ family response regulator
LISKREKEVMGLVVEGLSNREIANALALSEHTVKNYIFRLFEKLGVYNRVGLVRYALARQGPVDEPMSVHHPC